MANATSLQTFGDTRRQILQAMADVRSKTMTPTEAEAMRGLMDVLNKNIQVEINANKLAIQTAGTAHEFGKVVAMGQRLIANETGQSA
jgi:hypothetical protein